MSKRLYFLVEDEPRARTIIDDLREAGIDEGDLQAVAHRDRYPLEGMPEAEITDRTDFLPAARRGVALGGTTGLFAGLAAVALPGVGTVLAGGAMVATLTAAGAAVGTWASTLVGIGVTHRDLKPFEEALDAGRILVLVDIDEDRFDEIAERIRAKDSSVIIESGDLEAANSDDG